MKMITRLMFALCILGTAWDTHAQARKPVTWHFSAIPVNSSEAQLIFTATIAAPWHIYSQHIGTDGPLPTTFTFAASDDYSRMGNVRETSIAIKEREPVFDNMELVWFETTAVFMQKVKLYSPLTVIHGKIEFMACTREECRTPEVVPFSLEVKAEKPAKKKQQQQIINNR